MPSWEEQLQSLRGGGAPKSSWDDQLAGVRGGPPPAPPPPPEETELGIMERFAQGAREMGRGALYGANQGMMLGGADEAEAAARVAAGGDWQPAIEQARADVRSAREGAPWTFEAARMAGSIPGAAIGGVRAMIPQGIAGGALSSDSDDWEQTVSDAAGGGLMAGAMGVAGQALGNTARGAADWVGDKAQAVGDWLGNASTQTRGRALGGTPGQFQTLGRERGLDYVEGGLGEAVERQGLTNRFLPQSPSGYATKAQAAMDTNVSQKNAALEAAANELDPSFLSRDQLVDTIGGQAGKLPDGRKDLSLERGPMGSKLSELASHAGDLPPNPSPMQMDRYKMDMYDKGYAPSAVQGTPESMSAQAHQRAGRAAKDQLHGAMRMATPETEAQFFGANQNIGELAVIRDMSRDAAAKNAAQNSPLVQGITAGAGALAGGSVGDIPGMVMGGAIANRAYSAAREYGPDAAANALALGRDAAHGFGSSVGGGADMMERFANSSAPRAASNYVASGDSAAYERSIADGRGHMLAEVVQDALQNEPQALGPYAQQFGEAMGSRRSGAVNALLSRLSQTDETWRTQYLPALRARTGGDNRF